MKTVLFLVGLLFILAGIATGFVSQLDYGNALIGLNLGLAATLLVGGFVVLGLSAVVEAITTLTEDLPDSPPQERRQTFERNMPFPAATAPAGAVAASPAIDTQFEKAADKVETAIDKVAKAAEEAVKEARTKPDPDDLKKDAPAKPVPPAVKPEPPVAKPVPPMMAKPEPPAKPVPPMVKPEATEKPAPAAFKQEPATKPTAAEAKPEPAAAKPEPAAKPAPAEDKPEAAAAKIETPAAKPEPEAKAKPQADKPVEAAAKDDGKETPEKADVKTPEVAVEETLEETPDQLYVIEELVIRGKASRLLSDNTIEAETAEGWMRFENAEHLEEYLDAMEK